MVKPTIRRNEMCNVLVVDDDKDVRDTLVGVLGDDGYVVYAAENESKTLQMLTQEQFDYAIVDLRLHGNHEDDESGISLAMTIRFLSP